MMKPEQKARFENGARSVLRCLASCSHVDGRDTFVARCAGCDNEYLCARIRREVTRRAQITRTIRIGEREDEHRVY